MFICASKNKLGHKKATEDITKIFKTHWSKGNLQPHLIMIIRVSSFIFVQADHLA